MSHLQSRLSLLTSVVLGSLRRGIEKESLRVRPDGTLLLFDTTGGVISKVDVAGGVPQAVTKLDGSKREARHVLLIPKPFTGSQIARALDELLKDQLPDNQIAQLPD